MPSTLPRSLEAPAALSRAQPQPGKAVTGICRIIAILISNQHASKLLHKEPGFQQVLREQNLAQKRLQLALPLSVPHGSPCHGPGGVVGAAPTCRVLTAINKVWGRRKGTEGRRKEEREREALLNRVRKQGEGRQGVGEGAPKAPRPRQRGSPWGLQHETQGCLAGRQNKHHPTQRCCC